ncbi:MAG TPA: HAMP domain-containing sensor histidine kinase [Vicinamibacterales bacterium]
MIDPESRPPADPPPVTDDELERRVHERTSELEAVNRFKDELLEREQRARDAAELASRAKDELLATLSHELRDPLHVAIGWVHQLRQRTLPPDVVDRALDAIDRSLQLQTRLVNDLVQMAQAMQGRLRLNLHEQPLAPIVERCVEELQEKAEGRSIMLTAELQPGIVAACDAVRFQQVVWNLVTNAIKFTPAGGRVTVTLDEEDGQAVLTVSDSGIGIDPAFLPHAFDPFSQAESSAATGPSGLGLGLTIVRQLVELHGGTVSASSGGLGLGTTFRVALPMTASADTTLPPRPRLVVSKHA